MLADRFKLSVCFEGRLQVLKDIPGVYLSISQLNRLLQGDIYRIVKRFIEVPYENEQLQNYSILRLTGQSCRIDLFREALKEFIPGRMIESSGRNRPEAEEHALKLMCLDGAVKYMKDRRFGYADVTIVSEQPAFSVYRNGDHAYRRRENTYKKSGSGTDLGLHLKEHDRSDTAAFPEGFKRTAAV